MAVYFWLHSALHAVVAVCRSAAIAAVTLLAGVVSSCLGSPFVPLIAMTVTATLMTHYILESDWVASLELALFIPIGCIAARLFWRASETTLLRNLVG